MLRILPILKKLYAPMLVLVVIGATQVAAQTSDSSKPLLSYHRSAEKNKPAKPPQAIQPSRMRMHRDVEAASFDVESPRVAKVSPPADPRQLAPPTSFAIPLGGSIPSNPDGSTARPMPQLESLTTAGTGLALVVGLFLVCMWLMRRTGPKPTTPLPREAVAVLGRVPLAARNFAHLLQVGNKLVLVALTPDGVTPITEVTDPKEVDRLLGLCLRDHKNSSTAEFQQVLQQLANEPAKGFLGNEAYAMSTQPRR